jgi:tetratricopeptide (TPR) repeat protein
VGRGADAARHPLARQQQPAAAEEEFTAARGELEAMGGDGVERRLRLAEVYHNLGILHDARGTPEEQMEALRWYEQGLKLRQELVDGVPHDRVFRRDLARSHGYLGDTQLQLGLNDEASASYDSAADLREGLVAELRAGSATPEELVEALCQRARDLGNRGTLHDWTGGLDRAIDALEERRRYYDREGFR